MSSSPGRPAARSSTTPTASACVAPAMTGSATTRLRPSTAACARAATEPPMAETPDSVYAAAISGSAKALASLLWRYVDTHHNGATDAPFVWPSRDTLARQLSVTRSTVFRCLAELQAAGLITQTARDIGGAHLRGWSLIPGTPQSQLRDIIVSPLTLLVTGGVGGGLSPDGKNPESDSYSFLPSDSFRSLEIRDSSGGVGGTSYEAEAAAAETAYEAEAAAAETAAGEAKQLKQPQALATKEASPARPSPARPKQRRKPVRYERPEDFLDDADPFSAETFRRRWAKRRPDLDLDDEVRAALLWRREKSQGAPTVRFLEAWLSRAKPRVRDEPSEPSSYRDLSDEIRRREEVEEFVRRRDAEAARQRDAEAARW
jgi:hypothetical protein